jgi:hypothetical protein
VPALLWTPLLTDVVIGAGRITVTAVRLLSAEGTGILASIVCTAIIPALGASRAATVAGAAISPVLVAVITTRGPGLARSAGIAVLAAVALVITVSGFTLPELVAGRGSLVADRPGTFVDTERTPKMTCIGWCGGG